MQRPGEQGVHAVLPEQQLPLTQLILLAVSPAVIMRGWRGGAGVVVGLLPVGGQVRAIRA
ncbi:hypothetical protein D5H78_13830 [Vallicoccus soli]|uniref:Uncharacterized protein n=1 Tax=Vallicoccus soli TaxID=2339232 RepID=A0A3A3YY25_9ACTN|nr:hypothetical protein D5H78_13830 [Vallicoccus soli]